MRRLTATFAVAAILLAAAPASSAPASAPSAVERAVALVACGGRRGSGAVTSVDGGYILTAGHIAIDPDTGQQAESCVASFVTDATRIPDAHYAATIVRAVFDKKRNRDFAILKIGPRLGGVRDGLPSVPLKISVSAAVGAPVTVYGYPASAGQELTTSVGSVLDLARGSVTVDAPFSQGTSGGPAIDANGDIVGVATSVNVSIDGQGNEVAHDYSLGDTLHLTYWLDLFGIREHDRFLLHADGDAFHSAPYVVRDEGPGCLHLVRTPESTTVYCLLSGAQRLFFPNESVYFSWYPDFSGVQFIAPDNLAEFRLAGNVTHRAGTLVKIQTDPKVYLVVDSVGTMRWLQTEQGAAALFGPGWAAKVRDVPDSLFVDYAPLPEAIP